ncbi:MAG: SAM-dependent methyltransferase [Candidatus Binatia bacterium]
MAKYERKDPVYRDARAAGYRSRSALKLREIDRRFRVLKAGDRVLDLGCWPGGWLQVAAQAVGDAGRVVGVDIKAVEDLGLGNVTTVLGDLSEAAVRERAVSALGGDADVVLCDMAPQLSGVRLADSSKQQGLAELALSMARRCLGADGRLVIKLFSGIEAEASALLKRDFKKLSRFRPDATRKGSSEIYAVASGPSWLGGDHRGG